MIFELWQNSDKTAASFFPRDENYLSHVEFELTHEPTMKLVWSYDAKSYFEAMQAYHDYMGWKKYTPEPDWEDIVYD